MEVMDPACNIWNTHLKVSNKFTYTSKHLYLANTNDMKASQKMTLHAYYAMDDPTSMSVSKKGK